MNGTPKVVKVKIKDLIPDSHNANRGNERGRYMIGRSVEKHGAGRGIALDRNLKIVAGNKTVEALADAGIEEILLVRTDGNTLVATVREDWDLDDPKTGARDYAYADNRSAIDIDFDPAVIAFDLEAGLDLSDWFKPYELDLLMGNIPAGIDPNEEWKGMPEFENEAESAYKTIKVHFLSEGDYQQFSQVVDQPLTEKTISIYYPRRRPEDLTRYTAENE